MARETTIYCNKCGQPVKERNSFSETYLFGYDSMFDGEEMILDLCYPCLEEFFNSCVIHPIKSTMNRKDKQ